MCEKSRGAGGSLTSLGQDLADDRLELAIRGSADGIWDRNLLTDELHLSERWCEIFGYRQDELEPGFATFRRLVHPEDRERVLGCIRRHLRDRAPYDVEFRGLTKDGGTKWVHSRGQAIWDGTGRATRMAGSLTDITRRKDAEEALKAANESLRRSEQLLNATGRLAKVGGWEVDLRTNRLAWTEGTRRIHEVSADFEPTVEAAIAFYHPEDRPRIAEAVRRAVEIGEPFDLELRLVSALGRELWVHSIGTVEVVDGAAARVSGTFQDITARVKAESEIVRVNRLHSALMELNAALVRVRSREELFREVPRILVERGGFRMSWVGWRDASSPWVSVAGSHGDGGGYLADLRIAVDDRPEGRGPTGTAIREGNAFVCDDFLTDPRTLPWREVAARAGWRASAAFPVRLDGRVCGALTVYAKEPRYFGDREVALLEQAAADISFALEGLDREEQRRRAQDEVRRLNRELESRVEERTAQLEATNRELEAFSYSISHDLRAPLRAIEGFSAMVVRDHAGPLDIEGQRLLGVVRANALRMSHLIDDLLSFSRTSRREFRRSLLDMKALARSAHAEVVGDLTCPSNIDFRVGDLPPAEGDPAMVLQVWTNLISNAVKFSARRTRPLVEVGSTALGGETVYSVSDNGVGFNMDHAGKLFGVFHRLHSATEYEGTGVGLALVKRIVERHGGRVWAESEVDRGARFLFTLAPPSGR